MAIPRSVTLKWSLVSRSRNSTSTKKASGNLSTFRAVDPVMMKFGDTWKRAEVVTPHSTPRSCVVRDERKQHRRNRKMLRPAVVASRDSDLPATVPSL